MSMIKLCDKVSCHLFPNILTLSRIFCYKEYIFRTIKPFFAKQNDVIKNFAVVMSAVIKKVDCSNYKVV